MRDTIQSRSVTSTGLVSVSYSVPCVVVQRGLVVHTITVRVLDVVGSLLVAGVVIVCSILLVFSGGPCTVS
jgi:hypothetical protein